MWFHTWLAHKQEQRNSREAGKQVLPWAGRAALTSQLSGLYRRVAVAAGDLLPSLPPAASALSRRGTGGCAQHHPKGLAKPTAPENCLGRFCFLAPGPQSCRKGEGRPLTSPVEVVRVHEGEGLVAAGALLGVALVHGAHHYRHLLPRAAHRLLPLLGQFPWDRESVMQTQQGWTTCPGRWARGMPMEPVVFMLEHA